MMQKVFANMWEQNAERLQRTKGGKTESFTASKHLEFISSKRGYYESIIFRGFAI